MRQWALVLFFAFILSFSAISLGADEGSWSFIIFGDSRGGILMEGGFNIQIVSEIADEIVRQKVDFVAFPGDLVIGSDNGKTLEKQLTRWRDVMEPVYNAGIGVYPVRGNHDVGGRDGVQVWRNVFSGRYGLPENGPVGEEGLTYAVEHKNVLLLGLDQYVNPHRVNKNWLDAQLANNDQPHVFVFGHEPAFQLKHEDCLDDYPEARDAFWGSLKEAGVRVYACGHDHFLDHAIVDDGDGNPQNDVHQFVAATAGAPLRDWKPPYQGQNGDKTIVQQQHHKQFGYLLVEVLNDSEYKMTWYGRDKKTQQYAAAEQSTVIVSPGAEAATTLVSK